MSVDYERHGRVAVITVDRPEVRNAIDRATASALGQAWTTFEEDDKVDVGVLYGAGGHFSSGADLKAFDLVDEPAGYLGFTRTQVSKPTIAAVEGYCVAGGFEMALWCDLRVAATTATFGCLERRFGVPLVDGGNVRLPYVVGLGVALEMILTGREVTADEAYVLGLVNVVVNEGAALEEALELARVIGGHPQETVRSDRAAVLGALGLPMSEALELERHIGAQVLGVAAAGADRFAAGAGRSGTAIPQIFATAPPLAADAKAREAEEIAGDTGVVLPGAGTGRPVLIVATERSWQRAAEEALRDMGFVTYSVGVEGEIDRDLVDLGSAVTELLAHPSVLGDRVAIAALGPGAAPALHLSTVDGRISALVEFSGTSPDNSPSFRLSSAAYLGHHGSTDDTAGAISPFRLEAALRDLGVDATFHTYRGVGADFFVPGSEGYDPDLASAAWQRTRLFLQRAI
jgi:enoyl-CoA hydratase